MRPALVAVTVYALLVAARFALPEGNAARLGSILPQIFVVLASARVALDFGPQDTQRKGWLLVAVAAATMILTRIVHWSWPQSFAHEGVLMASNVLFVIGILVFFNLVRKNPLIRQMSSKSRPIVYGISVVAIIAACVGAFIMGKQLAAAGWSGRGADWTRLAALVGLVCDAAVCILSLQLVGYLSPMAGGTATRPYLILSIAGMVFLVLDLLGFLLTADFGYGDFGLVLRLVVLAAWTLYVTAAVEQHFILRDTRDAGGRAKTLV